MSKRSESCCVKAQTSPKDGFKCTGVRDLIEKVDFEAMLGCFEIEQGAREVSVYS